MSAVDLSQLTIPPPFFLAGKTTAKLPNMVVSEARWCSTLPDWLSLEERSLSTCSLNSSVVITIKEYHSIRLLIEAKNNTLAYSLIVSYMRYIGCDEGTPRPWFYPGFLSGGHKSTKCLMLFFPL